ncbi:MAG TPA: putative sulfate exporter family transporter [Methylomirabilota bacterium]|nr:putative sulfate exporter family transporter [Methylomirabilota bacterium]
MARRFEGLSEDWLAVVIGLVVFALALGPLAGADLLGWAAAPKTWIELGKAIQSVSADYVSLGVLVPPLLTFGFTLLLMLPAAAALGSDLRRFAVSFTAVFWLAYFCWIAGNWAYIAVTTPADLEKFGILWSLKLTGESGYLIALLLGLVIANFLPGLAGWLRDAARPELFIKIAIVILGGTLGIKAAEQIGLASSVMFRGLAAIIEAYLIYWAVVYWVARRWFGFSREWAAPLASGISICGVSAAIATAAAIRARPIVAVMVSSLVVIFAMVELLILPFLAAAFLSHEPMVAAAWMGLAVKTDGAAVASGAITESLVLANAAAQGVVYEKGWMLGATTTVKIFIDIFIGVWAFLLAFIWTRYIEPRKKGDELRGAEIWERFPKFVLGFVATFLVVFLIALASEALVKPLGAAMNEANVFRQLFFLLTFFSIGLLADLRKLWEEGIGRLAAVYVVCLFGFVIWVGLAISFIFFQGVHPPLASG